MKKQLLIISVLVVIVSIFVSCSANSGSEDISTTAVTDSKGTTHYYEPVTDDKGNILTTDKKQGVFAEIETQSNGKAVTEKNGKYVTNEHTTILPIKDETTKPSSSAEESSSDIIKDIEDADNVVEFQPTKTTEETKPDNTTTTTEKTTTTTTETTTQKEIQPATDKDGWITKWY